MAKKPSGQIIEENDTASLYEAPRHPYTQKLLSSILTPETGLRPGPVGSGRAAAIPEPDAPSGTREAA